jgi:hypothetical protein
MQANKRNQISHNSLSRQGTTFADPPVLYHVLKPGERRHVRGRITYGHDTVDAGAIDYAMYRTFGADWESQLGARVIVEVPPHQSKTGHNYFWFFTWDVSQIGGAGWRQTDTYYIHGNSA